MFKLGRLSIATRALAFVVVVCGSLIAIDAWRTWAAYHLVLQAAIDDSSNMTKSLAQEANDTIKEADTALVNIVERVETDGTQGAAGDRLQRQFENLLGELPQLNNLLVFDARGRYLASAQAIQLDQQNIDDREYFIFHQTHAERGPHVGIPIVSRSTGKWVIPVSRRINHPNGSFAGVALANIEIRFFSDFYNSFTIGNDGVVALILDSGILLVRRPLTEHSIGQDVRDTQLYQAYRAHGLVGGANIRSSRDEISRIASFRRLTGYPLLVMAGFSRDALLGPWRRDTALHSAGVLLLVLLLSIFGRRLVRQIALRLAAQNEVTTARDALQHANRALEKLALQDGLTELANRRNLNAKLEREFEHASRTGSSIGIVMIDVDSFKQFNDIYGHVAGDECLKAVARAIMKARDNDADGLVARYGGEEFAVLLPGANRESATRVGQDICREVVSLQIVHSGSPMGNLTVSVGAHAFVPALGEYDYGELIRRADVALYRAKSSGRNCVKFE
jgi:diguanylate cyclase (GGDEF)-like protein